MKDSFLLNWIINLIFIKTVFFTKVSQKIIAILFFLPQSIRLISQSLHSPCSEAVTEQSSNLKKILFIGGNARSLIDNRGDLITQLNQLGHNVMALVPAYDALPELEELNIKYELIELNRLTMNPWNDFINCLEITKKIISLEVRLRK